MTRSLTCTAAEHLNEETLDASVVNNYMSFKLKTWKKLYSTSTSAFVVTSSQLAPAHFVSLVMN